MTSISKTSVFVVFAEQLGVRPLVPEDEMASATIASELESRCKALTAIF